MAEMGMFFTVTCHEVYSAYVLFKFSYTYENEAIIRPSLSLFVDLGQP